MGELEENSKTGLRSVFTVTVNIAILETGFTTYDQKQTKYQQFWFNSWVRWSVYRWENQQGNFRAWKLLLINFTQLIVLCDNLLIDRLSVLTKGKGWEKRRSAHTQDIDMLLLVYDVYLCVIISCPFTIEWFKYHVG